jgi:pyruvate/2-oxoglutarate dehydrogenase complex dihydrolipoamide dehydrogenase (E3) component
MVASARAAHVARSAGRLGVRAGNVEVDLGAVVDRKDAIVRQWREGVAKRLSGAGERLTLVRGRALFVAPREIEVDGQRHSAETVIVNVGCRPAVPPLPGLADAPWLDNRSVMALRALPRHLLVLGGGYIGCEFAQMFRRFGAPVTVVDVLDRLLGVEDPETSAALAGVFEAEGIALELGQAAAAVERDGDGVVVRLKSGKALRGSHLLVAVGRVPNTKDLGCDAAGIALDPRGYIAVDDRYRTSAEGVYAVGDVTPGPQFTHASWDDHRALFEQLMGRPARKRADRRVPIAAFADPQVARVGLTEQDAKARGRRC